MLNNTIDLQTIVFKMGKGELFLLLYQEIKGIPQDTG